MISVKVKYTNNHIIQISVSGHADSDELGKDLVCAAVSAVTTGICNELDHRGFLNGYGEIVLREGFMQIDICQYREDFDVILETLMISLKTIEEQSSDYVKIREDK